MSDSEENLQDESISEVETTDAFKTTAVQYVATDDEIKELESKLRKMRKQNKTKEQDIIKYLDTIKEDTVNVGDNELKKEESSKPKPISAKIVKQVLIEKLDDPKIVQTILEAIDAERGINRNVKLSRNKKVKKVKGGVKKKQKKEKEK